MAVPVFVLGAFLGAGPADFGARLPQERGMFRAAPYKASGQGAYIGAVAGKADAAGHELDIGL